MGSIDSVSIKDKDPFASVLSAPPNLNPSPRMDPQTDMVRPSDPSPQVRPFD